MPELPAEAVQAATDALTKVRCTHTLGWSCAECRARAAVEAAAPFLAGVGSPASCPSAAPESTQSPETTVGAPVYRSGVERPAETLSAPPGEPADLAAARERITRAHTELGDVCAQGPSRRFKMHIPADPERDTDLIISAALNDADLLVGEVEQLRAAVARAREANRRLRAALIASAHLLDVPYTNAPDQTPWTRSIKPAMHTLAAILDSPAAVSEQTGGQP